MYEFVAPWKCTLHSLHWAASFFFFFFFALFELNYMNFVIGNSLVPSITQWQFISSDLSLDLHSLDESCDLVPHSEALALAKELRITYMETSALTLQGVKACFEYAVSFSIGLINRYYRYKIWVFPSGVFLSVHNSMCVLTYTGKRAIFLCLWNQ